MKKNVILFGAMAVLLIIFFGCTGTSVKKDNAGAQPASAESKSYGQHKYYEFPDVLIPGGLKIKTKKSSIYRTPSFVAGLLVFKGRYDGNSLAAFFENNMAKDNWGSKASIKFNPMIQIYEKENRVCVIRIEESTFDTTVEVWMAPTTKENASTVFN